jgi:hypothetical protein
MKLSLLRYSAWISLVFMALGSCRSSKIFLSGDEAKVVYQSFITGSFEKQTFKAKVSFQEKELSGRMMIKNTGNGYYKIAFYNEVGMTYLEGTIENSSKHKKLIIKNIVPILNHKPFIKSFEKSLQTVFSNKLKPIAQSTNPPSPHASKPPSPPTSPLTAANKDILFIQLRNGFKLELSPQITQINTE